MKVSKLGRMIVVMAMFSLLLVATVALPAVGWAARESPVFQAPIYSINLTPALVASVVGAMISLGFTYIPKLNVAWAALKKEKQQLIMLGLMVLTTVVIMLLGCYQVVIVNVTCDQNGVLTALMVLFGAVTGNQVTFRLSPQPNTVSSARAARQ